MIELESVTVRFGETTVIDALSLDVPDGQFIVIVGANGSGKTSLVRTFNGLVTPTSGAVFVNGTRVEENPVHARRSVAMVFQDPRDCFVAATVGDDVAFGPENLGLSPEEIETRVRSALAAVRMDGREVERIDALSGGERERVAIAGALAMQPSHLVLDEPLTGLDAAARESVLDRLGELSAAGTGIVLVTHEPGAVLDVADRLVGLSNGEIALDTAVSSIPAVAGKLAEIGVTPPSEPTARPATEANSDHD